MQVDQIVFSLPFGYSYGGFATGSGVNATNSSSYPSLGDWGTIYFKGYIPQAIFPFESFLINANDSIVLKFKAKMRCTSSDTIDVATVFPVLGSIIVDSAKATSCVGCGVLPVNLLYFNANMVQNQVLLEWATASELNNEKFSVYRSYEGLFYELITELPGAGNCQQITNYSAVDQYFLHVNRIFYKLKQTDYDGKQAEYYTKLNLKQPLIINCYPNPFSNDFRFLRKNCTLF